ncbi:uncharacterized protein BJ171DRAFT_418969, partial [Polychytrium aggregatum]|uniref:uncharacterized protein n=1 Tax=Polychytrium aggregatum TaxID=110093 RepID=UPI0022FE3660
QPAVSNFKILRRRLHHLRRLPQQKYDCCMNACMAFTVLQNSDYCTHCNSERYQPIRAGRSRRARKTFTYMSVISRLGAQFHSKEKVAAMQYRCSRLAAPHVISDIFDGKFYKSLVAKRLFSQSTDVALSLTLDGFRIFER